MCKVKALVGTFKQENALVGTITVIVKTDGSFAALVLSSPHSHRHTNTGGAETLESVAAGVPCVDFSKYLRLIKLELGITERVNSPAGAHI